MKRGYLRYLRYAITFLLILCMLGFLSACGSGGGSGNIDDYKDGGGDEEPSDDEPGPSSTPRKISLATTQVSVKSDNSDSATITATVLDKNNAVVENAIVEFSADGGQLSPKEGTETEENGPKSEVRTNASGKAEILFSSGTIEKSNRVVTVTARVEKLSPVQIPITVSGTTVSLSTGKTNLETDPEDEDKAKATLTITVKDAGLQPIYDAEVDVSLDQTSTGDAKLALLPPYESYRTDLSGQIKVQVTGTESGSVIVKAVSLGATATQSYVVGGIGEVFSITEPEDDIVSLSTGEDLVITVAAPDFSNYSVAFATTLGAWDGGTEKVVVKPRDENKTASAVLRSDEAGLATIQVYKEDDISRTDTLTVAISAPSSEASQIALQATAAVVAPSTEGVNNTVTLIATVKNAADQVVGGAPVAFSLENTTGGGEFISPVVVMTEASGRAETIFTSGSLSSDAMGVTVKAQVVGVPGVEPASINIVIGGTAGSVVIGRGTTILSSNNDTAYELPMSVLVSDTNGNAMPGAEVSLKAWPLEYATGYWVPQSTNTNCLPVLTGIFPNEDKNRNLILNPGEDVNADGKLTPHNSAAGSLPSVVVTDENGVANFSLVYLKTSAAWIQAEITATTLVFGTETQARYLFDLPWLDSDAQSCSLPHSPYNLPPEVELLIEAVPTVIPANGINASEIRVLVRDSNHNPVEGGDVYFSADLGTVTPVAITDGAGYAILGIDTGGNRLWPTLTSDKQNGVATVTVRFGDYEETVEVAFSGVEIQVTANPESLPTGSASTITATLKDAAGDPMAGNEVVLTTSLGSFTPGAEGGTVSDGQLTATTNTEGRVTATLTSPTGGIAEVTAYHGPTIGKPGETSATTTVSFSGVELTIVPEAASLVADGVSTTNINLELKEEGVPIADQTLILSTTLGAIDYTVTTDADGKATATLAAGNVVGVAIITATANLGEGNIVGGSIEFPMMSGIVDSIEILVDPPVISVDTGTADIAVTVRDVNGNPVGAAQVAFTIIAGPGGGETITPARITTPGPGGATPGQVTSVFKAGSIGSTVPKDVVLQVRAGDADSFKTATANLTIVGRPANIALGICTVYNRCVINNDDGTFSLPVAAVVSDVNGIAVPGGYLVYFSTDTPEVGAMTSPAATDDTGKATTTLIFPQTALGSELTVAAECSGIIEEFTFEIPFADDEIANVYLAVPATILADGIDQVTMSAQAVLQNGDWSLAASFFETNEFEDFTGNPAGNISNVTYLLLGETIGTLTANPSPEDYTIWVRASATEVFSNVEAVRAKGVTIEVEAANDAIVANGQSSTTVTATVKETTSKKPVANAAINFGVDKGTIEGSAFTDGSGTATTTFTSPASSQDLTATVFVYYGPELSDSTEIRLVAFPEVAHLFVSATRTTLYALPTETSQITVQALNPNGNPVPDGQEITFSIINGPGQIPVSARTTNGMATVTFTATPLPGTATIEISSGGVTETLDITMIEPPPPVGFVTVTAGCDSMVADGATGTLIKAVVYDIDGNNVADGTVVEFTTTAGTLSAASAETVNGVATVTLTSSTNLGTATVVGIAGGVNASTTVQFVAGPVTLVTLTANPNNLSAGGIALSTVQATVTDFHGNPVASETVSFNVQYGTLSAATAVTNSSGVATVLYTAPDSVPPGGTDTVTATSTNGTAAAPINISIIQAMVGSVTVTAGSETMVADGATGTLIKAVVRDVNGNYVPDGTTVNFTTTAGSLSADSATTINGVAMVTLTSSTNLGTATIVAIAGGVSDSTTVQFVAGPVTSVVVTGFPANLTAGGSDVSTIQASVTDFFGNPVTGETITFTAQFGSLSAATAVTNASGIATVDYMAPAQVPGGGASGLDPLTATSTNGTTGGFDMTIIQARVGTVTVTAGSDTILADGGATTAGTTLITAVVEDVNGNNVPDGTVVSFTTSAGTLSADTATTTNGVANVTLISSTNVGTAIITGTAGGVSDSTTVTFIEGPVASVVVIATPNNLSADGVSTSTIQARATDANGNPVADETISFSAVYGTVSTAWAETNENGIATITYTAPPAVPAGGIDTVTAVSTNGTTGTVDITIIAALVGSVTVSPGSVTIIANGGATAAGQTQIMAVVKDLQGNNVADGTIVTFDTTAGTLNPTSAPTSSGVATVTLSSSNNVGVAVVRADAGGVDNTTTVTFIAAPVAGLVLKATPPNLSADGASTSTIQATATDGNGNPVANETITFNVQYGTLSAATAVTNASGVATVTYTAPTTVPGGGVDPVNASSTNGTTAAPINITLIDAVVGSITVTAGSTQIVANGGTTPAGVTQITAVVTDIDGNPVEDGTTVNFETTAGTLDSASATTTNGVATVNLSSSTNVGFATVGAVAGGVDEATTVEFIAGPAVTVLVTATPGNLTADGESTSLITVTVFDAYDNPISDGELITFSAVDGSLSSITATTTGGVTSIIYTAPNYVPATGFDTITAETTNEQQGTASISLIGPTIANIELRADPSSLPADGTSQALLYATVTIVGGGSAPDGTTVNFSITQGGGTILSPAADTAGGVAVGSLRADNVAGTATIRAQAGGRTAETTIEYTPGSVEVTIIPNSVLGTGDETAAITAVLRTVGGAFAVGETVVFTVDDLTLGSICAPYTLTTNAQGEAFATFCSADKGGTATVTATWNTGGVDVTGSDTIEILPPPAFLEVAEGFPDPTAINIRGTGGQSTSQIVFNVKDATGTPVVNGYRIDFSIESGPDGGEEVLPLTALTSNGQVGTILQSGFKSGPVLIKATYFNNTSVFTFTSEIAINGGPPVGEEFGVFAEFLNISGWNWANLEDTITVNAGDIYGNAVPDGTAISFFTYNTGGFFNPGTANTVGGLASNTLISGGTNLRPTQGFVSVTGQANNGGRTTHVTSIAVTPEPNNHIMYAGTDGGGVYKTTNSGATWTNTSRSSTIPGQNWIDPYVNDMCIDPDDINVIYAATGYLGRGNVYRSLDGGLNWNSNYAEEWRGLFTPEDLTAAVLTVVCDGADSDYIWIGTEGAGALFAPDGENFRYGGEVTPIAPTAEASPGVYTIPNRDGFMTEPTLSVTSVTEDYTVTYVVPPSSATVPTPGFNVGNGTMSLVTTNPANTLTEDWLVTYAGTAGPVTDYTPANTGTGYVANLQVVSAVTEDYTLTCITAPNTFSVVGSVSGPQLNATVGTAYTTGPVSFTIVPGATAFVAGDDFTFSTTTYWDVFGSVSGPEPNRATSTSDPNTYTLIASFSDPAVAFTITAGSVPFVVNDWFEFSTTAAEMPYWTVVGEVSGLQNNEVFNSVPYASDNGEVSFTITDGTTDPFEDGDAFTFNVLESGLSAGKTVHDIVKVPDTHGATAVLYAATNAGAYSSTNGGVLWQPLGAFPGDHITTLELHPLSDGTGSDVIYAGTEDAGVWVSTTSGAGWTSYTAGMGKGLSATTPVADRDNVGTGIMSDVTVFDDAMSEYWTVTCVTAAANGGIFEVVGSESGGYTNYTITAGTYEISNVLEFTISDGAVDFAVGDQFTFSTTRDEGRQIKDLLVVTDGVDNDNDQLYAVTYFWGPLEPHAVGNVYVHELVDGTGDMEPAPEEWAERSTGLPRYDPPDDITLFAQHALAGDMTYTPTTLFIGGEGIHLFKARNMDVTPDNPSWVISESGLTNLIMARMPVLFSGACTMDITQTRVGNLVVFTVYIQDVNGNPPVAGSTFQVQTFTPLGTPVDIPLRVTYPDVYTYEGTFRDPQDPTTDNPYIIPVIVQPSSLVGEVVFTFNPADTLPDVPGNSGSFQEESFNY